MTRKTLFVGSALVLLIAFVVGDSRLQHGARRGGHEYRHVERGCPRALSLPYAGAIRCQGTHRRFLDPACETCAAFYPFVKKLMAVNPGRIRLSIRYAPFHKGSGEVVKALEAARKQGKYWEALEALLASQAQWTQNHTARVALVWQPLALAGVNVEQAKNDMEAPEIARSIEQDVEDGKTLNVNKTPEFFVNGRPLPSFGHDQLRNLVQEELARAYR